VPAIVRHQRFLIVLIGCCVGCTEAPPATPPSGSSVHAASAGTVEPAAPVTPLPTISLGNDGQRSGPVRSAPDEQQQRRALIEAMQPLQVMLGTWKGTTQREFGDFKALDEPEWVWDFQTDPQQPALVMSSTGSPYFRSMRLTYLPGGVPVVD
jgi:hypothetical protein